MDRLKWFKPLNILKLQERFSLPDDFYMIFLAAIVGVVGGFTLVIYHHLLDIVNLFFFDTFPSLFPDGITDYIPIIIPALGGIFIASIFIFIPRYEKEYGAPAIMDSIVNLGGYMPKRLPIITFFASILCISTGGSVGKEGPSILICAGIASFIGSKLKLSSERLRLLVGAGAATGLAAAFNVPIAAAIFTLEIIMADFSMRAFSPVVIASVFSTTISRLYISDAPVFQITEYALKSPMELPLYLIMGALGGYIGVLFIRSFRYTHNLIKSIKYNDMTKTIIGFLIVGVLGFYFNEVYGFDSNVINEIISGNYTIGLAIVIILVKIVATNITMGSGGIGGLFTPTLIIGGLYGFSFGLLMNQLFPEITAPAGAYAVVGMAVLSTGVQHAMLSSIIMIFECTSDYHIMLPMMIAVVPAIIVSRKININSIYTMQFEFWGDRIARGRNVEILEKMNIEPCIRENDVFIHEHTPLLGIINKFMESGATTFPVVNDTKNIVGTISLQDIRSIMFESSVHSLLIAQDICRNNVVVISENENFETAFHKLDIGDFESLPVVFEDTTKLRGVIARDDLMKRYRKELLFNGS